MAHLRRQWHENLQIREPLSGFRLARELQTSPHAPEFPAQREVCMNLQSRSVDPLFGRHEMMLELGRLDMYIARADAEGLSRHEASNDQSCGCCVGGVDKKAFELRARIHESLSAVPV